MKYADGEVAHLGDVVTLAGKVGRIVCSMDTAEYGSEPAYSAAQWGYLDKGVMAEFPDFGLIHFLEPESDLKLVRRRNELPAKDSPCD